MTELEMTMTPDALSAWSRVSRIAPRADSMTVARAAMHAAVAQRNAAPRPFAPLMRSTRRQPWRFTASMVTAAAAGVIAIGWNAPAGSTLYSVRTARENVVLAIAGGAQPVALRLGYAEDRLHDAASGHNRSASLQAASALLNDAHGALPADHHDPLYQRWEHDESELSALRNANEDSPTGGGGGGSTAPGGGNSAVHGGASTGHTGSGGDGHGGTPDSHGTSTQTSSTAESTGGGDHSPGSSAFPGQTPDAHGGSSSFSFSSTSSSWSFSDDGHGHGGRGVAPPSSSPAWHDN